MALAIETIANSTPLSIVEPTSQQEQLAQEAARAAGIERSTVTTIDPQWARMLTDGVIAVPHIGRARFEVSVNLEDFGLVPSDENEAAALKRALPTFTAYIMPEKQRREGTRIDDAARGLFNPKRQRAFVLPTHYGTMVPFGKAECDQCGATKLEGWLTDHVEQVHPEWAEKTRAAATEAALAEAAAGQLFGRYTAAYVKGKVQAALDNPPGKERGWILRELLDEWSKLEKAYDGLRDYIYANWDDLMKQVETDYIVIGNGNYDRLTAERERRAQIAGATQLPELPDRVQFVKGFVERMMGRIKDRRESVRESFSFRLDKSVIPLASMMAEDQSQAESILLKQSEVRETVNARRAAIYQVEREIAETRKAELEGGLMTFVADMRGYVSSMFHEVALDVLAAIQKNGEVPGASVKQLRNLLDKVQMMVQWDDPQIEKMMATVRSEISVTKPSESSAEIRSTLKRIGAEAKLTMLELGMTDIPSGRGVGIPDTLQGLEVVAGVRNRTGVRHIETSDLLLDVPADFGRNAVEQGAA